MKRRFIAAAAIACGLFTNIASADIPYVDVTGQVTVNGVPTAGVTVEAIPCDGATLPADWPTPAPNTTSTAAATGANYLLVFVTSFGNGATPGPTGSVTFASPANGAWYTAIDIQLKFSFPGYQPVILTCDQVRAAYVATLGDPNPGVPVINVDIHVPIYVPVLVPGDTATKGFWANKNGQVLIKSLNGGPLSTQLANWLAGNFPYIYGANAGLLNNLTGQPNLTIATLAVKLSSLNNSKPDAQILATALSVYVTDSDLAGNAGVKYGFNVSATGTAEKVYNVGANGTAIGLANNTNYSILALLQQANLRKQLGNFNASAFNAVFTGINNAGAKL